MTFILDSGPHAAYGLSMTTKRIIGLALLAAALMFGFADLLQASFPSYGAPAVTMGWLWALVSARSLSFAETLVRDRLWAPIWEFGFSPLLVAPAWSFFGVLGGLFIVIGRPQESER